MKYFCASFLSSALIFSVQLGCQQPETEAGSQVKNLNQSLGIWKPDDVPRDDALQNVQEIISVSGRSQPAMPPGKAQDGRSGDSGPGSHGFNGANGRDGKSGEDAQDLRVKISYTDDQFEQFEAQIFNPLAGGNSTSQSYLVDTTKSKFLLLLANGGRGQPGANGGDGGNGRQGFPAPLPVFEGQQTFGGQGGDGGDGGSGGNGGDGGDAGNIYIEVPEDQTETLWFIRAESNGGPAGDGGSGGNGGRRGVGGSPTIRQSIIVGTRWETVTRTRINENGERETYQEEIPVSQYAFRNPGPNGRNGRDGRYGDQGISGQSHSPTIQLTRDGETVATYNHMFEVVLDQVNLGESIPDGVYEPGEFIYLDSVRLKNIHQMPSPNKKTIYTVMENGGISKPNQPIEISDIRGLKGFEEKQFNFEEREVYYQIASPTNPDHQKFLEKNKTPPNIAVNQFQLSSGLQIANAKMPIGGGKNFLIQTPLTIEYPSANAINEYPISAGEDTYTHVPIKIKNNSKKQYGSSSYFESVLPDGKTMKGAREVKVRISHLKRQNDNYINETHIRGKVFYKGKELASTMELENSPIEFEIESIAALQSSEFELRVDIWDDTNLAPGSELDLSVQVFVSPLPGETASKLIGEAQLHFVYSLYYKFEADLRLVTYNKQIRCHYPNIGGKKWRVLDRIYITKSYNQSHPSDPANLEWGVRVGTASPFSAFTPMLKLDINHISDYYDAFLQPRASLTSFKIVDFMNEHFIPTLRSVTSLVDKSFISKCEKIPTRRLGPINIDWMFREIMPRQFNDHILLPPG